ncbi:hypothetical protein HELRODRAFT_116430 [Helobdella robusta]|uniref:P-type domain-containing protein n=1 Tax=Helobdella robusta TaxID=6412 RepID=T1EGF0_HELRO|nr:hypothetical protein HELRODRAFT_116430 [Helobdella robusta]ESN90957.1 hypothetical protein HELRODRAFT_116430 [Helobdella robusta]
MKIFLSSTASVFFCFVLQLFVGIAICENVHKANKCLGPDEWRFDCYPGTTNNQASCDRRGCCGWAAIARVSNSSGSSSSSSRSSSSSSSSSSGGSSSSSDSSSSSCYFPTNYPSYKLENLVNLANGHKGFLISQGNSSWPNNIRNLTLYVWYHSRKILQFKIVDSESWRYEVPIHTPEPPTSKPDDVDYNVDFEFKPFGIKVTRHNSNEILFNSLIPGAPLIYADQFLQISTLLQSNILFGLGEDGRHAYKWRRYSYWARDLTPMSGSTLIGEHPFYINVGNRSRNSHGVLFLNSNAVDFDVQPTPALTFRSIGGVLDFYIFTGPTMENVVQQYVRFIGIPAMPPFWALGFHLSNSNYQDIDHLKSIIERNRDLGIPYEAQWIGVDHMENGKMWTYDGTRYKGLPHLVEELHNNSMKSIITLYPGISRMYPGHYPPYDRGIQQNVFIRNSAGDILEGRLGPGPTVYPDFTHPNASSWWLESAEDFHKVLPFDGLCLDMNQPSNLDSGSTFGCTNDSLDRPPYVPDTRGNGKLEHKTLCASARQYISTHYNLHNLYGLSMAMVTQKVLAKIIGKRTLSVSRSTFPSHGKYGQHWSAGWKSDWDDMRYSIKSLLNSQMFGIPFVGTDVCGFADDSNEDLCIRWTQLGAFYPFMRNHNDEDNASQDPGAGRWSSYARKIMKDAIELRYSLLPFMYTQFYLNQLDGSPVIRPLSFAFPNDLETYYATKQFLWGTSLLVSPFLEPIKSYFRSEGYLPRGVWYDVFTHHSKRSYGGFYLLDSSYEKINLYIRGGSVLPRQKSAVTTALSRKNPISLLVAMDMNQTASGELFWDDGETFGKLW